MTIKQFIEKAIEGGWDKAEIIDGKLNMHFIECDEQIFLDPKPWQAIGKIKKWQPCSKCKYAWEHTMHDMIDALAEGKTIEEFIKTL